MSGPSGAASPDLAAILQAGNEVSQGWIGMLQRAAAPDSLGWMSKLAQAAEGLPAKQAAYAERQFRLWQSALAQQSGAPGNAADAPASRGDRRFSASAWRDEPFYRYLKDSYLLAAEYLEQLADAAPVETEERERLRFAVRQWVDALSPANFAATNPQVLAAARETQGESIARGLANLIADAHKGRISQSDESRFEVGGNLAVTPGAVVYENELIQLIQYAPSTDQVAKRPLVIVPPCINKFYILDLQPENSFVRHAVGEGHTVFMVSWRNIGSAQGALTWDDYLEDGVLRAIQVARRITRAKQANVLGFCVGGTLLGAALAVLAARGDDSVASATFLATMLDFSEPGQIGLFVDEPSLALREASIGSGGVMPGSDLAFMFSSLRANELVWPYVVGNYLLGNTPAAFDLLFWNADSTNLPGPMYCTYVRNTYLENRLREPGALTNCGVPVDLGSVKVPTYVLATREDHIVPWRAAYRSAQLLGGETTFVLGASGHVAGIVNPPAKKRRSYWTREALEENPATWQDGAEEHPGSWWPHWSGWLAAHGGGHRKAPAKPGAARYPVIEPAPGRYVRARAEAAGPLSALGALGAQNKGPLPQSVNPGAPRRPSVE